MTGSRNGTAAGFNVDLAIKQAMTAARQDLGEDYEVAYASEVPTVGRLSTGSAILDYKLGGGIPLGRITHVPGPPGSGRTTLMYVMIAKAQADGRHCVFVDADRRFNAERARTLGVNTDTLVLLRPRTIERAFAAIETFITSSAISLIVVDSVGSWTPNAEYLGDFGDNHTGLLDSRVEQGIRKVLAILDDHNVALVMTNQYRTDHKVIFGSGQYAPGELDNFAALTLDLRRSELLRRKTAQPVSTEPEPIPDPAAAIAAAVALAESDAPAPVVAAEDERALEPEVDTFGIRIRVKIAQNSDGKAYLSTHVHIVFDEGISREGDLIELGVALGVLNKKGASVFLGDTRLGKHEAGAAEYLRGNCEVALTIEAEILTALDGADR